MFNDLANKAFRHGFLEETIRIGLAFAIRAIRESQKMTQGELAKKAKKADSVISRLEDPNYGKYTIKTLLALAKAFDVALLIKFVPYSKYIAEHQDVTPEALSALSYQREAQEIAKNSVASKAMAETLPSQDKNAPNKSALASQAGTQPTPPPPINRGDDDDRDASPLGTSMHMHLAQRPGEMRL